MPMSSNLLRRAIELNRAGERDEANRILKTVLRQDPTNQVAWNWYIETLPGPEERIQAVEQYLLINPNSRQALKALDTLKRQAAAQPAIPGLDSSQPIQLTSPTRTTRSVTPGQAGAMRSATSAGSSSAPRRLPSFASLIAVFSILFLIGLSIYAFKVQQKRDLLQGEYDSLQDNYTSLNAAHEVSVQEKAQLKTQLDELWADYDYLNKAYKDLSKAYLDLEARYNLLAANNTNLDSQYTALLTDYGILQGKYTDLKSEYGALSGDYDELVAKYTDLYGWYDWLQTNAVKPPYIAIHNRQVAIGFYGPSGKVETMTKDISELEHAITLAENHRNNPPYTLLALNGETVEVLDLRKFIDPEAFNDYIPDLYRRSVSDDEFILSVWRIVSQLNDYAGEIFDAPRHPLETFLLGGGDSEDTAILLASMILAAPTDWDVKLVLMDSNNPYAAKEINHVIVYVNTGSKQYLIESTSSSDMLWPADIEGWYLDVSR
jgi:hypothetical protein